VFDEICRFKELQIGFIFIPKILILKEVMEATWEIP
jgi:hypothetical protein